MPGRHSHNYPGFRSKAQWRYFFASKKLRKYAHKWAHETPGGPKIRYRRLPERVGLPRGRTLRGTRRRGGHARRRRR